MNANRQQSIQECLQKRDVQERIWRDIREARSKATVTISRAANLFNFKESQLREWERRGLLQTERSVLSQEGKEGHRQYTPAELDKLAIIRELLNQGYSPGEIPANVDKIWTQLAGEEKIARGSQASYGEEIGARRDGRRPIDEHVEENDRQEFWRYFVTQTLRISLMLICEDVPDTAVAGLILPLQNRRLARVVKTTTDLHQVGPALVGWQGRHRSFYTFLDDAPAFEYPSDFRLETLLPTSERLSVEDEVLENLFIVVQRRARQIFLSLERISTIRRLLNLLYAHMDDWRPCFEYGRRDWFYQAHDLTGQSENTIFHKLVEQVIEMGRPTGHEKSRWNFCALLLPRDASLPLQQQSLVIRAQTRNSPYELGITTIDPGQVNNLCLKAFQSGQIISLSTTLHGESMIHSLHLPVAARSQADASLASSAIPLSEEATQSAIAVPLAGDYGLTTAVLYIASEQAHAFSLEDQRALRIITHMMEELLLTSSARSQLVGKVASLVDTPSIVDTTFRGFGLETEFIAEVESQLLAIQKMHLAELQSRKEISIIAVDIDNQSSIAMKYGNRVARNLSQQVGSRIRGQARATGGLTLRRVFHVSADRYYLLLDGVLLEEAGNQAKQLKEMLEIEYRINPSYATPGRLMLPENMLVLSGMSVHIGISSYSQEHLQELFERYSADTAVMYVRALMVEGIEESLRRGRDNGGNCIITWDRSVEDYKLLE